MPNSKIPSAVQSAAFGAALKATPVGREPGASSTSVRGERWNGNGLAIFLTGLSGSGKTAIAKEIDARLSSVGYRVTMLDGDDFRARVSPDLGFSRPDREANLKRAGIIATEVLKYGGIAICSFIAPYEQARMEIRHTLQPYGHFFLVHIATSREECERRDPKGLYLKARAGILLNFTGVSDVYEDPVQYDFKIDTIAQTVAGSAGKIIRALASKGLLRGLGLAASLYGIANEAVTDGDIYDQNNSKNSERNIQLFQRFIQATSGGRVTLNKVANEMGVERHTVEKIVRAMTGKTFRDLQRTMLL